MEEFIRQQNVALFRKRLAQPHTDAEREMLLKLLAEEQAKSCCDRNRDPARDLAKERVGEVADARSPAADREATRSRRQAQPCEGEYLNAVSDRFLTE
jgi:hypothetical protein